MKQWDKIFLLIEEGITNQWHSGAQVYISYRGETVVDFAVGERSEGMALQSQDKMLWLSSGKPILAVAIAQLWEKGKMDWDEPIAKSWPEFGQGGKESLTVRHLLMHTGGMRGTDLIAFENLSWAQVLEKICHTPREPNWIAGEKAGYHRSGSWIILAELLQRVVNQNWQDYIRENIFLPAGMFHSHMGLSRQELEREKVGEMFDTSLQPPQIHANHSVEKMALSYKPGSNALGPIRELGFFYQALIQNKILKKETLDYLIARHRKGMWDHTFRQNMDWGLGFMLNAIEADFVDKPYHFGRYASEKAFGHAGAQSSFGFVDPAYDLIVSWVFNGMPGEKVHHERTTKMNEAIYQDLSLDKK
ncbi:MAG: beta-lactamase family protein [Verrucomicrobiae bacterium]|nr:beta-lactamase family protein [Verrucomicrobiae bacterium]